jgi:hypothetical protein
MGLLDMFRSKDTSGDQALTAADAEREEVGHYGMDPAEERKYLGKCGGAEDYGRDDYGGATFTGSTSA